MEMTVRDLEMAVAANPAFTLADCLKALAVIVRSLDRSKPYDPICGEMAAYLILFGFQALNRIGVDPRVSLPAVYNKLAEDSDTGARLVDSGLKFTDRKQMFLGEKPFDPQDDEKLWG